MALVEKNRLSFDFAHIDRAVTNASTEGLARLVSRLALPCGPHAGKLIHEYVLALSKGMKASDVADVSTELTEQTDAGPQALDAVPVRPAGR